MCPPATCDDECPATVQQQCCVLSSQNRDTVYIYRYRYTDSVSLCGVKKEKGKETRNYPGPIFCTTEILYNSKTEISHKLLPQ